MKKKETKILLVDDEPDILEIVGYNLSSEGYQVITAENGVEAIAKAKKHKPHLIILDVMMPEMDGREVCKRLKSQHKTCHIPVIFVTAMNDVGDEEQGFAVGAVDYITKPVIPPVVLARVKTHLLLADQQQAAKQLVKERTRELEDSQHSAVSMLAEAGHYNDTDTGVHIWRMAAYAEALARAARWPVEQAGLLELAAPMHDMGKIGIPDEILKAPRRLTDEEMATMQTHAELGYQILSKSSTSLFRLAAEVARYHHEKWDGSGYPFGLADDSIPESARIVAVADVFDALTMKRPYKDAWPMEEAMNHILDNAGSHFDPNLVEHFLSIKDELLDIKRFWDQKEVDAA